MRNLTIFHRLALIIAVLAVTMVALAGAQIMLLRRTIIAEREVKVREMVDIAKGLLAASDAQAKAGKISAAEARQRAFAAIGSLRWGQFADYFGIYGAGEGNAGVTYVHPNPKYINVNRWNFKDKQGKLLIQEIVLAARAGGGFVNYAAPHGSGGAEVAKIAYVGAYGEGEQRLAIQAGVYVDDVDAALYQQAWGAAATSLAGLLVAGVIALIIGRGLTRPLNVLCRVMDRLAGGELELAVPFGDRRNEIGRIARSLSIFQHGLMESARLRTQQALERQMSDEAKKTALRDMADKIEREMAAALQHIQGHTTLMSTVADGMAGSADHTGAAAETAASMATQAMSNARAVAATAEQLTASIRDISGQMNQSTEIVAQAVAAGHETRGTIESLNHEVTQISKVADMIGAIAANTNLLALNATIEAARAGEAGKGFAVVASEVKALATQTARSTREIGQHIDRVRTATAESVAAVTRIEQAITQVNNIARAISVAIYQQGAATAEIARNISQAAAAAHDMTERTTEVSAAASHTGRQASEVRHTAAILHGAMEELRHTVVSLVHSSTTEIDQRQMAHS